jgi:hypothetical protein
MTLQRIGGQNVEVPDIAAGSNPTYAQLIAWIRSVAAFAECAAYINSKNTAIVRRTVSAGSNVSVGIGDNAFDPADSGTVGTYASNTGISTSRVFTYRAFVRAATNQGEAYNEITHELVGQSSVDVQVDYTSNQIRIENSTGGSLDILVVVIFYPATYTGDTWTVS